jgi:periplasmic divalent cation tolerance protein
MADKVVVFVTCENSDQAAHIAEAVVREKLAACVNIVGPIRSCYVWEGKFTWSDEVLAIIKTTNSRFTQLEARIRELHTYETPEIISVAIDDGFEPYLRWIDRAVGA